jgi:hypothetical protein
VLPRTFPGGDRDMQRRFLDAMAIVQRWGKPDYFITMTCNPYWEEITTELMPGQLPQDRPDLDDAGSFFFDLFLFTLFCSQPYFVSFFIFLFESSFYLNTYGHAMNSEIFLDGFRFLKCV